MILGTLRTEPLQDHDAEGSPIGQFELIIAVDDVHVRNSADSLGYCRHVIAQHIAHAVYTSRVPPEHWAFFTSKAMLNMFPDFPTMFKCG